MTNMPNVSRVMLDFEESDRSTEMTISVSVPEAASQFAELLNRVKHGEEVTIIEAGVAIARLIPAPHSRLPRSPGQDAGRVMIAPDFNAPLPDDILNDFLNPGAS